MANPIVGAIGLGGSVLGSLMSAGAQSQMAKAQSGQMMYQAGLSMFNAQIAEQNANYALQIGERQAAKYGLGAREQAAQIKAGQSASGVDVNSGSAREVQTSQHTVSMMDMDQIRANAAKAAFDFNVQAQGDRMQGMAEMYGAKNIQQAGKTNVLASLVGGASSVADKWLQAKDKNLFGDLNLGF